MTPKTMTLTNDFHGTSVRVRPRLATHGLWQLNARQARRVWRTLCGNKHCQCGDNGIRGLDNPLIEWAYNTDAGPVLNLINRAGR